MFTDIFVGVSLCVCVCVVFGVLLYMVFSFKTINISIDFQVSDLLYFMFGVLLLSGNIDEFSVALESQLQFLPGPNILPTSESTYLGQIFSSLPGLQG